MFKGLGQAEDDRKHESSSKHSKKQTIHKQEIIGFGNMLRPFLLIS